MNRKRALDLALLLPTLPFFAAVTGALALLVLIVDGRPVFFLQPRAKKGGAGFRILKLRSMTTEPDWRQRKPTRLGGWLRQHGLDELPQLFNVLLGDMSLVGPRPLKHEDIERLQARFDGFEARLEVPPGLTGLAQITLVSGAEKTARVDGWYALNRDAAMDVGILLRTVWINLVGKRKGARVLPAELKVEVG